LVNQGRFEGHDFSLAENVPLKTAPLAAEVTMLPIIQHGVVIQPVSPQREIPSLTDVLSLTSPYFSY